MILSKTVSVLITYRNITYYKLKNYECYINTICDINIDDLPKNSHYNVSVKCDICNKIKELSYQKYIKNISKYDIYTCSEKCAKVKNKITNIEKYGVEYPTQCQMIKDKIKTTVHDKYSVDNVFQLNTVKQKSIKTNNILYGVNYPQQNKKILEKSNITNLKKYGVDRPSKNITIKNKIIESYKKRLIEKFSNINNITNIDYTNCNLTAFCEKGHEYNINIKTLYSRYNSNCIICTVCNPIIKFISDKENELHNYIKENYNKEIISNSKDIIKPYELDIYIPDLNLAFEFNGVYWHNELNKEDDYHNNKTNMCLNKGIQLIHIWEDDWIYKQDIVKSMILNKLNKNINKIYARKTTIKEITDNKLIKEFLNNNHLQGFVGSKIKIGLFYDDDLVSLMTFGNLRKTMNSKSNSDDYEMLRFCNKLNTNVIGGASKLFNYFINNYKYNTIISYADRSYSNGNLYKQLGFELDHITEPNYYYVIDGIRHYRYNFRKDILIKEGYDSNKTEHEIMLERKIYRIYNSGNYKFKYKFNRIKI